MSADHNYSGPSDNHAVSIDFTNRSTTWRPPAEIVVADRQK